MWAPGGTAWCSGVGEFILSRWWWWCSASPYRLHWSLLKSWCVLTVNPAKRMDGFVQSQDFFHFSAWFSWNGWVGWGVASLQVLWIESWPIRSLQWLKRWSVQNFPLDDYIILLLCFLCFTFMIMLQFITEWVFSSALDPCPLAIGSI